MGKIRVADLAKMMGVENQDLLFKLKSLGIRLEDENAQLDSDVIQAILEGKRLPQPREVILRDEEAKAAQKTQRKPLPRRLPRGPARPSRRRPMVQKVQPTVRTIPTRTPPAQQQPASAAKAPSGAAAESTATATAPAKEAVAPAAGAPARTQAAAAAPKTSGRRARRAERRTSDVAAVAFKEAKPEGEITVSEGMTVREFAEKLDVKAKDLMKVLFDRGVMVTINQVLDADLAVSVAEELGVDARAVTFEEEVQLQQAETATEGEDEGTEERAPVVTIMGHVDHGKTTLLDTIRSSKITDSEFGGITQHIGAYEVEVADGRRIVFLDTPGHEAFTMMRARGASATDIVVLVVAADDGVMPQTQEAIDHARAAEVPIVVAINKIDKANANIDKVKKGLANANLNVEDWGGDIPAVPISAVKKQGVDDLLEVILLTAELQELKANPELPARGVVLEARKEAGRGIVATVLVQNGSMSIGDVFVAGAAWGRVRSMTNDLGKTVKVAPPATPVEVTGFNELPDAGDAFQVVEEESKARSIAEYRANELRQQELAPAAGKASLDQLFRRIRGGELKELKVVLKADVQGSLEVVRDTLLKLGTEKVAVDIIRAGVGAVTTNDVLFAAASEAVVIGFNIRPERNAADLAEKEQVDIRLHTVIYQLTDELRKAMAGLLEPTYREVSQGRAEVREIFNIPKVGTIAGCHVVSGVVNRNAPARLVRDNTVVYEGKIGALKRFKDDAAEVRSGFDCGIRLENFQDIKPGDNIEVFKQEEIAATL